MTIESLTEIIQASESSQSAHWSLHSIPAVLFYRKLHPFLKTWSITRSFSKTALGKFYLSIDNQLQARNSSPYNTHRFIERVIGSDLPDAAIMPYGDKTDTALQAEINSCSKQVQALDEKVVQQQVEIMEMKVEMETVKSQIAESKSTLQAVELDKKCLERYHHCLKKKLEAADSRYESTLIDLLHVDEELLDKGSKEEVCDYVDHCTRQLVPFNAQTKVDQRRYSPSIRELYYSLLADQIPPAKIAQIVKLVLNCFVPSFNTDSLQLPQERCAGYMRREELKTVSMAHKAYTVHTSDSLNVNSDGTTKFLKKINGVSVNGTVLCLNEVSDGSADSMVKDIASELALLRETAKALGLKNPERINWTLFASCTSDSASTQKKFNRLVEQFREEDESRFGSANSEASELVENLCAMHLGSNLRKAFIDGIKDVFEKSCNVDSVGPVRKHNSTDTLVHEFCKLYGTHGVPEYSCGCEFADFLALKIAEDSQPESREYYQMCAEVVLDRQVGSRYFVSASNAAKIFFLKEAAIDFLEYSGRVDGNNLERTLYQKLKDTEEVAQLKADGIMFYFVYAELVMLAKSTVLGKSAFDMNQHYLELQLFLQMVEKDGSKAMNSDYKVFPSEERLYGSDPRTNHRIHSTSQNIFDRLFRADDWDSTHLFLLLAKGAAKMSEKLSSYAKNQLPGGKYWEPSHDIELVLCNLKPNNDICESILGFNDYLTTALPNMHQMTRSTLVEVKKNKTLKWLKDLPEDEKHAVEKLAQQKRSEVMQHYRDEERARNSRRQEKMKKSHDKREGLRAKLLKEKEILSNQHLISSPIELKESLEAIDLRPISASKKRKEKLDLIRTQINIRKKVLGQSLNIPFTHQRKQRPIGVIIKELSDFIYHSELTESHKPTDLDLSDPMSLVGKAILHKFCLESGEHTWFHGIVISYNAVERTHEIAYEDEPENQHYDLTEDFNEGDIQIVDK